MKSTFFLRFTLLATWLAIFSAVFATLPHISRAVAQTSIPPTWDVQYGDFESGILDMWQVYSPNNPVLAPEGGYNSTNGLSIALGSDSNYIYQTNVALPEKGYLSFWFNPNWISISKEGEQRIPGRSLAIAKAMNSTDLWVNANMGVDGNDGLNSTTALRTIQHAADLAGPGTTVHIMPGIYRETVTPLLDGSATEPVHYLAEEGPGTVVIRGSEPSSSLMWTQLTANTIGLPPGVDPTNIYFADLSAWNLDGPPRFVVGLDGNGQVTARLPLAREPDWIVTTDWKYHEYWWAADGGSSPAACDPATNPDKDCDQASRSTTQLTDKTNDANPLGVEAGNLSTLGNLTGATLVALDTVEGHYVYRRTIIEHNISTGLITVDKKCEFDSGSGNPGLGWGTKYYVEGKPYLLDTPGEWWYDTTNKHLYLWPPTPGNPASENIEISKRENGINLQNRSYVTIDGLKIEFYNGSAIYQVNQPSDKSYRNMLRNLTLRYANIGVIIRQSVAVSKPVENIIDGFVLEDSEIADMDSQGINLGEYWQGAPNPNLFTHSGVQNTIIRNNELHHLGFQSDGDNAIGSLFEFANKLRFESNHIYDVAHNGVQFSRSVIQSPKAYGFNPNEIKTGDILIKDNVIEQTCQLSTDCGGLKIWGAPPDNHVFRNLLITGNVFRNIFGWTYISEMRQLWNGGESSEVRGMGGSGFKTDHASGIFLFRNIAYNNAYSDYTIGNLWRDGEVIFINNLAANSLYGLLFGNWQSDTHDSVNAQIINNIMVSNEGFGLSLNYAKGLTANMIVDHNLYYNNGWRSWDQGGIWNAGVMLVATGSWNPYQTLAEVRANTSWEDQGVEGDPVFWNYDPGDHNMQDGSWPDFHLTSDSANAIDRGTTSLPTSLSTLLEKFSVVDYQIGSAYDIGRYEAGFLLLAAPISRAIDPGSTAYYTLSLYPPDIPYSVNLSASSPSPNLILSLSKGVITGGQDSILSVTAPHTPRGMPGVWYDLRITGTGSGFSDTTTPGLLVGGTRTYLPIIWK
jgi:hypothetical protein